MFFEARSPGTWGPAIGIPPDGHRDDDHGQGHNTGGQSQQEGAAGLDRILSPRLERLDARPGPVAFPGGNAPSAARITDRASPMSALLSAGGRGSRRWAPLCSDCFARSNSSRRRTCPPAPEDEGSPASYPDLPHLRPLAKPLQGPDVARRAEGRAEDPLLGIEVDRGGRAGEGWLRSTKSSSPGGRAWSSNPGHWCVLSARFRGPATHRSPAGSADDGLQHRSSIGPRPFFGTVVSMTLKPSGDLSFGSPL